MGRALVAAAVASFACLLAARTARAEPPATLPISADAPIEVIDPNAGMSIRVRLLDAAPAHAIPTTGDAVYPAAIGAADLVRRALDDGIEDLVRYPTRPEREAVTYSVDLQQVAGVRLVSSTVEFLDGEGVPRLRMAAPWIRDAKGVNHDATVELTGCSYSTEPGIAWEHPVVPPGSSSCVIQISWSIQSYPAELDPIWVTTGSMHTARADFALKRLSKTIVALGGLIDVKTGETTGKVETYKPEPTPFGDTVNDGAWTRDGSLSESRAHFEVVGYSDDTTPHEKVLVAGGCHTLNLEKPVESQCVEAALTAEIYDVTGGKSAPVSGATLTKHEWSVTKIVNDLGDGGIVEKVLVLGGSSKFAEVFTPKLDKWATESVPWQDGLFAFTATTFRDPENPDLTDLVVCGGKNAGGFAQRKCHVRRNGSWSKFEMAVARYGHTATLMDDQSIIFVGGDQQGSAERWTPTATATDDKTEPMPSMSTPRRYHAAARRNRSTLIVAGGEDQGSSGNLASAEGIAIDSRSWAPRDHMKFPRSHHAMIRISESEDKKDRDNLPLLVAGGLLGNPLKSAELIAPLPDGAPCDHDAACEGRQCKAFNADAGRGRCCSANACVSCAEDGTRMEAGAGTYDKGCPGSNATHTCGKKHRCGEDGCQSHDCMFRACVDGECALPQCTSISDCAPGADCVLADDGGMTCRCRSSEACTLGDVCRADGSCGPPFPVTSGQISCGLSEPAAGVGASMLILALGLAGRRRLQKGKLANTSGDQRTNGP